MPADHETLAALAATQHGLVTTEQLMGHGVASSTITERTHAGEWRRLHRGVYLLDAELYDDPLSFEVRLTAARLRHGDDTVAVLTTAGRLHGVAALPDDPDIHLARHPNGERHQAPGMSHHTLKLEVDEVERGPHGNVTNVLRTLTDLLLAYDRAHGVSAIDSALNRRLITPADLGPIEAALRGRKGAVAAREHLALVDGRAQSPLETRVRLTATDVGLPPDELQLPVVSRSGVLLGYGDLAWRLPDGRWLVGECDGASVHDTPAAVFRDRTRANAFFADADVAMVRFTWADWDRGLYIKWLIESCGRRPAA